MSDQQSLPEEAIIDRAAEVAAKTLCEYDYGPDPRMDSPDEDPSFGPAVRAALAAAYPLIEAAIREQIAGEATPHEDAR